MQTRIILIRHGETKANLEKKYIGTTESRLTARGKKQAKSLIKRMSKEGVGKVFSSSSMRATNFAKIIFSNSNIEILPELREMNFGVFEGLTHAEILKKYPALYGRWLKNPASCRISKAEVFREFKMRIFKAFEKIIRVNRGGTTAVITHAGPIRLILGKILKRKSIWEIMPALAGMSIIEFNRGRPKISIFNEITYYE